MVTHAMTGTNRVMVEEVKSTKDVRGDEPHVKNRRFLSSVMWERIF